MGLKVWNLVLVSTLLLMLLITFLIGIIKIMDLALLISFILILFASYLTITRKDPLTKVPTPLELEKMKRKLKAEDSGILTKPEK